MLVAARDLPVGSFVQPASLRWQDWPDVELPESYAVRGTASEADLVGAVVRRPMSPGEPVALCNLVKPGKLSLSLRSLAPAATATAPDGVAALTWDSDASPALRPENQPNSTLAVVRGGKTETLTVRRGAGT